jgi:hypothetical protein
VQPVLLPLGLDPRTQLLVFAVSLRNTTVPVDSATVGKLAYTAFPSGAEQIPFEGKTIVLIEIKRRELGRRIDLKGEEER